jgi:sugar phosphate isomerase/epimerase
MKLGISCKYERLNYLQEIINNYDIGIEITDFIDPDILNNPNLLFEYRSRYLDYFKNHKIERTFHGPFFDLNIHAIDNEFAALSKDKIKKAITICSDLGCKKIIFHTGYIPLQISKDYQEKIIENQIKFWQDVCDENKDLIICLENMFEKDSNFIYEILDNCKKDNLKLCFDIAHCVVFSNEGPLTWINKMDRYLNHIHLSDCNGIYDEHLALGSGSIDIIELIHKLQKINCNLTFVIEMSGEDKVRKSLNYLDRNRLIQRKNAI